MNKISCAELDFRSMLNALIEEVRSVKDSVSNSKAVYTNKEMRELLDVNDKTLRNYRNDGKLAYSQIGNKFYYTSKDLCEFLANNHMSAYYYC
jgi:hypothetical protein